MTAKQKGTLIILAMVLLIIFLVAVFVIYSAQINTSTASIYATLEATIYADG